MSEREDLNLRPLDPQSSALPDCATSRKSYYNSFGSRFRLPHRGPATLHAELGCVLGIPRTVTQGSTVYVARISRTGEYRMSKPCAMCHAVLKHVGVKKVVYTKNSLEIDSYKL